MLRRFIIIMVFLLVTSITTLLSQNKHQNLYYDDPCGYDTLKLVKLKSQLGDHWGYGYADLLDDIDIWNLNTLVTISNIGLSVNGREIPMVTIKSVEEDDALYRITIHARTHPAEVQSTHVTNEIIKELLSGSDLADSLLSQCVFNIIPMINPDGVELEYNRENANGIDIESNWNTYPHQPEVQALKETYQSFMASATPVNIALNMHSAIECHRFFVYHDSFGTSQMYAQEEKLFINSVRNEWPEGFENWDHYVSWTSSTPLHYPESWFWTNYSDSVLALTYEDMNCASAGKYDTTANAILTGIKDYLNQTGTNVPDNIDHHRLKMYPNPVLPDSYVHIQLPLNEYIYRIEVTDISGKLINLIEDKNMTGEYNLSTTGMKSGLYIIKVVWSELISTGILVVR